MTDQKKYLIIGPAWVGDMVMAQSLFIDIKLREPESQIDVLAPAWTAALIDRMPQVSALISGNFNHGKLSLGERIRLGKSLRLQQYTHAIVLPNSLKSALLPLVAKIPIRTGWLGEQRWGFINDIRKLNKVDMPMTVQRFIALGLPEGAPVRAIEEVPKPLLETDKTQIDQVLSDNQLDIAKRVLVLCPGAEFGASKQWPIEHYAQLAKHYLSEGWQIWLMGSEKDRQACEKISMLNGGQCHTLAGKTSLPEAVDLLSFASLVVSNDSGLMHIAAALQKPLVAVYGSTDPGHTPPLSENHAIARLDLQCSPCFQRDCPLGHLECLRGLTADTVISLSQSL